MSLSVSRIKSAVVAFFARVFALLRAVKLGSAVKSVFSLFKPGSPAPAAPGAPVVGWWAWLVGAGWHLFVYPIGVIFVAYLFVHALAFFNLDGWFPWYFANVVWWALAGVAYYVLVFVEHEPTEWALKWIARVMTLVVITAYPWHYGVTSRDGALTAAQYDAMYAHAMTAKCMGELARYGIKPGVTILTEEPAPKTAPATKVPVVPLLSPVPSATSPAPTTAKDAPRPPVHRLYKAKKPAAGPAGL